MSCQFFTPCISNPYYRCSCMICCDPFCIENCSYFVFWSCSQNSYQLSVQLFNFIISCITGKDINLNKVHCSWFHMEFRSYYVVINRNVAFYETSYLMWVDESCIIMSVILVTKEVHSVIASAEMSCSCSFLFIIFNFPRASISLEIPVSSLRCPSRSPFFMDYPVLTCTWPVTHFIPQHGNMRCRLSVRSLNAIFLFSTIPVLMFVALVSRASVPLLYNSLKANRSGAISLLKV